MRVIVQSIEPCSTGNGNRFNVFTLLDHLKCRFILTVEIDKIGDRELQRVTADRVFGNLFKYDIDIRSQIYQLVSAVYNRESIELPCDVGELEIERNKRNNLPPSPAVNEAIKALGGQSKAIKASSELSIEEEKSRQS